MMYDAKECKACERMVLLDGFEPAGTGRSGRIALCRPCNKARYRAYYVARRSTPEHVEQVRRASLKRSGWTPAAWDERYALIAGVCENPGCQNSATHADHDHDTGHGRWLLCHGCNVSLGFLGEDQVRIVGLAELVGTNLSVSHGSE